MLASKCRDPGSGPDLSMRELCWTEWHWDGFVVDRVELGRVCGGQWHWDRFVVDRVELGRVCSGQSGTGTGL